MVLAHRAPASRRLLTGLTTRGGGCRSSLGPLAFLVAYHTVNPFPLDVRHYRSRFAYFWIPALVVMVAVGRRS